MLEYLAHIDREDAPDDLIQVSITIDPADVEVLDPVPQHWNALAPDVTCQRQGDLWVAQRRSLALAVPSAIVPAEMNYLINPVHARFSTATIGDFVDLRLDPRLVP
jgi:RES domain-containing protein